MVFALEYCFWEQEEKATSSSLLLTGDITKMDCSSANVILTVEKSGWFWPVNYCQFLLLWFNRLFGVGYDLVRGFPLVTILCANGKGLLLTSPVSFDQFIVTHSIYFASTSCVGWVQPGHLVSTGNDTICCGVWELRFHWLAKSFSQSYLGTPNFI